MKTFTVKDLRNWGACYDPIKYLTEDWQGTAIDLLKIDAIPSQDRLWAVLRTDLVSERLMRLFAVWSARQVQHLMIDIKSIEALDVTERFANKEATKQEMDAAGAAARDAAWAAARAAARDAAAAAQIKTLIEMIEKENL